MKATDTIFELLSTTSVAKGCSPYRTWMQGPETHGCTADYMPTCRADWAWTWETLVLTRRPSRRSSIPKPPWDLSTMCSAKGLEKNWRHWGLSPCPPKYLLKPSRHPSSH